VTDAFSWGTDQLQFDNDVFTRLGPVGTLNPAKIKFGTEANSASDRLIYGAASGRLWYDPDGNGQRDQILVAAITTGLYDFNGALKVIR
jgi:Ca2+-binding RTX toxin-like protein